jgi:hypothetical protein
MKHLSQDEWTALVEADGESTHPHLASCAICRAEVTRGRDALRAARMVDVPEPSPLFWAGFSRRVSAANSDAVRQRHHQWPFWRVVVPLAVVVGVMVVSVGVGRGPRSASRADAPADMSSETRSTQSAMDSGDDQWLVLSNLAADFDIETVRDSLGMPAVGRVDSALWQLNERERTELAALLRAELRQRP